MANITDAYGTITLRGNWGADLNELLKKEDITNVKESKSVEVNQS